MLFINTIFNKRTVFVVLLLIILFTSTPKKSYAWGVTYDPFNFVQNSVSATANTITASATGLTAGMTTAEKVKQFVLDPIARTAARYVIKRITTQTVNWINSGFKGNPAFVTNPQQFFL